MRSDLSVQAGSLCYIARRPAGIVNTFRISAAA